MITFLLGGAGCGKTHTVTERIARDLRAGKTVYLVVPEQQSAGTELRMARTLDPKTSLRFEVLNFSRMANRVAREFGGLSYRYATGGVRALVMWRALLAAAPHLSEYSVSGRGDSTLVSLCLETVKELKFCAVTPAMLEAAADEAEADGENTRLARRLRDISLIYATYETMLREEYDDPADDLEKLAETLRTHDFFAGASVYFDAFYGFTAEEYAILAELMRQADDVTFALTADTDGGVGLQFAFTEKTVRRLTDLAKRGRREMRVEHLTEDYRHSSAIRYLSEHLFRFETTAPYAGESDEVALLRTHDAFEACDAAAARVCALVESGARYGEIAVVVRGTDKYRGVIDASLERYGIPFHLASRSDAATRPAVKLMFSALRMHSGNFRREDVIAFLKTGLASVTDAECDLFELYTMTWNINGRRYMSDDVWNMNPDGYTPTLTDEGRELLRTVNAVKTHLADTLRPLFSVLDGAPTAAEAARAMFDLLERLSVAETLEQSYAAALARGDRAEADELRQVWALIVDALDRASELCGDTVVTSEQFSDMLAYLFTEADIGTIPPSADDVTVGDAALLRLSEIKHVILLGANEGEFPAGGSAGGFFSESDRVALEGLGIELSSHGDDRAAEELFYFYRAVASASETLDVFTADSDLAGKSLRPSITFLRLETLLGRRAERIAPSDESFLYRPLPSLDRLHLLKNTPLDAPLRRYLAEHEEYGDALAAMATPLSGVAEQLSEETKAALFGRTISLSQSRMESFVGCRLGYYGNYVLKLAERRRAALRHADTGTFIHSVLERSISSFVQGGVFHLPTDREIDDVCTSLCQRYVEEVFPRAGAENNRMRHLVDRLRRNAAAIVRNICAEFERSQFVPRFFELKIAPDSPDAPPPLVFDAAGRKLAFYGVIDRVDTLRDGDVTYVRIVDYKTGRIPSDAALTEGDAVQLPIYLFTLTNCPPGEFREKLTGEKDGTVLPAGMLYMPARIKKQTTENGAATEKLILASLGRHGRLLDDPAVLARMDHTPDGAYIPVTVDKKGNLSDKHLLSHEGFADLYETLKTNVAELGEALVSGYVYSACGDACQYCTMKPLCRRSKDVDPLGTEYGKEEDR